MHKDAISNPVTEREGTIQGIDRRTHNKKLLKAQEEEKEKKESLFRDAKSRERGLSCGLKRMR